MRDRRDGDIDIVYSDCDKVINEWGWKPMIQELSMIYVEML